MKKGVFVYIDVANLNGSAEACGYKGINYPKLLNWLRSKRNAERVYFYAGYEDAKVKDSYLLLEKQGYILRLKKVMHYADHNTKHKLACPNCHSTSIYSLKRKGRSKANCDSELTLDVINDGVRKKYSEIIVFSADGDFCRMYKYVSDDIKKQVTIYTPMSGIPGKRTAESVKKLGSTRIITINALEAILPQYGLK